MSLQTLGRCKRQSVQSEVPKKIRGGLQAMIAACDTDPIYVYNAWCKYGLEAPVSELCQAQLDQVRAQKHEWIVSLRDEQAIQAEA